MLRRIAVEDTGTLHYIMQLSLPCGKKYDTANRDLKKKIQLKINYV